MAINFDNNKNKVVHCRFVCDKVIEALILTFVPPEKLGWSHWDFDRKFRLG